jgi:hypothetical protein
MMLGWMTSGMGGTGIHSGTGTCRHIESPLPAGKRPVQAQPRHTHDAAKKTYRKEFEKGNPLFMLFG